ncbi:di-heme-cytochrome C peroxidase [Cellvibrio mixtus]|uniref:di-heme-cytochrome C peroxidase n=1 Tax=Cellvibrio mixtus TaxID=39650 RepID=UPI000693C532|nr:di-heme-cytochrome C peroxidase [Cellvibrio mixtus]
MDFHTRYHFLSSFFRHSPFRIAHLAVAITLTGISACTFPPQDTNVGERNAKVLQQDSLGDSAERVVYPEQNWSAAESVWFYNATQGSNLIPYDLFLHLELPDREQLFRSDENMNRLRYLPQKASAENPDSLPVGWVKDNYEGKEYIGFTCAACHTSQVNYKGTAIRIDGGAPLADMDLMLKNLASSLQASIDQPKKFERLARNVLKEKYPEQKEAFRAELVQAAQQIHRYNQANEPRVGEQSVAYGYARLDAFGRIYNRILNHLTPQDPANVNPANAPVSYPFLWDTPQHDFVQWNGIGDNEGDGPIGRNVGEALGVFASFDLHQQDGIRGYRSSVNIRNLQLMEHSLANLWSPRWEDLSRQQVLPPINQALAEKGRTIFMEYQCLGCHSAIERTDPNRRVIAQFSSLQTIGTDPLMAINALKYTGKSGLFQGQKLDPRDPSSKNFDAVTPVLPALSLATGGIAAGASGQSAPASDNPIKSTQRHLDYEVVNKKDPRTLIAYKARPLNGIWATAPYLHNGSVPSLYELFLPSCSDGEIAGGKACRPNRFTVGALELDPIKVGFVQRDPARYPSLFVFDTSLPGNSNKGHEYTAGVTPVFVLDSNGRPVKDADGKPQMRKLPPINDDQRLALVEYLKTL